MLTPPPGIEEPKRAYDERIEQSEEDWRMYIGMLMDYKIKKSE